ncbi:hypothetical protein FHG87_019039 [Trinorchestia longiramus]|nr:hypothetical protein FHG87_019039 [Trinorchestia longiramus]
MSLIHVCDPELKSEINPYRGQEEYVLRIDLGKAVAESMLMKVMFAVESWPEVFTKVHVKQSCTSPVEERTYSSSSISIVDESPDVHLGATRKKNILM